MKISKYTNEFNSVKNITGNIVLKDDEKNILLENIHDYYDHKGIEFMRNEILRRKFIWQNYFNDIKLLLKNRIICAIDRANKIIKPNYIQIISYSALERIIIYIIKK